MTVRECEPADLDRFQALGSEGHARSNGIGTTLMQAAEARTRGHALLTLGVEDTNPRARRLYERLGYVPSRTAEFVYLGAAVPNPGAWMRKELA